MSNEKNFSIAPMFQQKLTNPDDYTFCGVFDDGTSDTNKFSFLYSINLTQKLKAELIICGTFSIHAMYSIAHDYIEITKGLPVEGEITLPGVGIMVNGEGTPLRIYVKDVTGQSWLDETIMNRCDNFDKVYQIYFGDIDNKLPTDEGNTDSFNQVRKDMMSAPPAVITLSQ